MRTIILALCLLTSCAAETPAPVAAPQICRLERAAVLKMAAGTSYAVVPARLNGQDVSMLLDTGDEVMTITPHAKVALGLAEDHQNRTSVQGLGGIVTNNNVRIEHFELGGTELFQPSAAVAPMPSAWRGEPPLAGIIGAQVMSDYDVEFDFPGRIVTLWQRSGCGSVAPAWQGPWASARLVRGRSSLVTLDVTIEGQTVRALLDTGAQNTTIDIEAAGRLGVTAAMLARGRTI
jgi:predicted aspartyl protease